ncbi:MAG: M28 family peptidase [Acidobacteriota bacterium]
MKSIVPPILVLAALAASLQAESPTQGSSQPEPLRSARPALLDALDAVPEAKHLARWHDLLSSEPHLAGSEGDRWVIDHLAEAMDAMGLEVEVHRFWAYLSLPVSARLTIVDQPSAGDPLDGLVAERPVPVDLAVAEPPLIEDPDTEKQTEPVAWNAYAASGDVTAPVVYANYGTKADFERLAELEVPTAGAIVLARYGGNFRGFKAKYAEAAGAAGLVMFSDPGDSGFARGLPWPEGGWGNRHQIQHGSILTLPWAGDPLTPFEEASEKAERRDPATLALPKIPVQPVGWEAALEILRRMRGSVVPPEWQGGLPLTYRLGGGPLRLRLQVEQRRQLVETANVLGTLRGSEKPDQKVIMGSHHDAWSFGAGDPNAGSIVVLETARAFAQAARQGHRPRRSVVFAHWGAEEFGIIGSTEWVEGNRRDLAANAVAYINLDGAAMGTRLGVSASPVLQGPAIDAATDLPHPRSEGSMLAAWQGGSETPPFGNLGGGSDHVAFYCHLGIPSIGISGRGSPGSAYHSAYETLAWYRQVVGDDYNSARMLSRLVSRLAANLADSRVLPYDPAAYAVEARRHLSALADLPGAEPARWQPLVESLDAFAPCAEAFSRRLERAAEGGEFAGREVIDDLLLRLERAWLAPEGLPERPWFRNLFAATDPTSGYAAWMLPALRRAIEASDGPAQSEATEQLRRTFDKLHAVIDQGLQLLPPEATAEAAP